MNVSIQCLINTFHQTKSWQVLHRLLQSRLEILRHILGLENAEQFTAIYYTIRDTVAKIKICSICDNWCQRSTARQLIMTSVYSLNTIHVQYRIVLNFVVELTNIYWYHQIRRTVVVVLKRIKLYYSSISRIDMSHWIKIFQNSSAYLFFFPGF